MTEPPQNLDSVAAPAESGMAGFSVDEFLPSGRWSPDLRDALEAWQQGDLIKDVAFTWAGPAEADSVTGVIAGEYAWEPVAGDNFACAWAAVVSQTCDIGASGPGKQHPFVQVCPVVKLEDEDSRWPSIQAYDVVYLFPLTAHPQPGRWVIDLRLSMPVSKHLIAASEPIDAFNDPRARLHLADALARKTSRPALHDALSENLPKSFEEFGKEVRKRIPAPAASWLSKVDHVRVLVTGDPLKPTVARLFVVVNTELDAAETAFWNEWHVRAASVAKKAGFPLHMHLQSWDQLRSREYADSTPLHLPGLGLNPAR